MRILLVEPDVLLGKVYNEALHAAGYIVDWVTSAQAAVYAADKNIPNVVILEMQLKQHNGVAFLQEFRSYADWEEVPVLLHTVLPPMRLQVFKDALQEMGVSEVMYKPQTTLRQLIDTTRTVAQQG